MQSSFTPPRLCLLTANPMLSLRLQLLPVPSQESRQCHMPMFTLCTLSSAPRFYCYSIPYVNSDQDRTPKGAVFRLHGLFLDIVTDSLNILPPLLYARVVTGHSWGMFLEIDLWGQRAYVLSRRAVPLVAIPLRRVLRDTHAT